MPPDAATARARAAVPLLDRLVQQSLDEDYRLVASRREPAPRTPRRKALVAVVVAAAGLLAAVAFAQTARTASLARTDKDDLVAEVSTAKAALAAHEKELARLRTDTATSAAYGALTAQLRAVQDQTESIGGPAGAAPSTGPGIEVTLTDGSGSSAQVRDVDLRTLINALWLAGARAIAVNGQRLTNTGAVRNSGTVVRLNGLSLSSPYVVSAVGSSEGALATWIQTSSGVAIRSSASEYGLGLSYRTLGRVTVPAAPSGMLDVTRAQALTDTKGAAQ